MQIPSLGRKNPSWTAIPQDHRKEEVYAQPEDNVEMVSSHSDASEIAATTEESYTTANIDDENSNSPAPASSEVLNYTIILSLNAISRICGLGLTDDLIATLRDDAFSLEMFRERVKSVTQIRRVSASIIQDSMKPYEFLTKHFKDEPGMFVGTLYYFDAIEVLRKQISLSNNLNTKYLPVHPEKFAVNGSPLFDHPLNTAHSVRVFKGVREEAIVNESPSAWWLEYSSEDSSEYSMVGFLQVFIEKTHTTP